LKLPARSTDEVDGESDPYAVVLFSDIRPLLVSLHSARAKNAFRLAWLSVLGLHIPGFCGSLGIQSHDTADDRWAHTHLATQSYLSQIFPPSGNQERITGDACAGVLIGREIAYASGFGPVRGWSYDSMSPLECLCDELGGFWRKEDVDVEELDKPFIRRVFEQLRLGNEDFEWNILALMFEAAVSVKGLVFRCIYITCMALMPLLVHSNSLGSACLTHGTQYRTGDVMLDLSASADGLTKRAKFTALSLLLPRPQKTHHLSVQCGGIGQRWNG
jgi:hypothetical protein